MEEKSPALQNYIRNRRRLVLLYLLAVCAASSMVFFYVWQHVKMVEVEKAIMRVRRENARLKEEIDLLVAERARLGRLERVETDARVKLGMEAPGKEQVWYLPAPLSTVQR